MEEIFAEFNFAILDVNREIKFREIRFFSNFYKFTSNLVILGRNWLTIGSKLPPIAKLNSRETREI